MSDILKSEESKVEDHTITRLHLLAVVVAVALSILVIRLWFLQAVSGSFYKQMADENRIRSVTIQAPRGIIYDRNREPLAVNRLALTLTILPENAKDKRLVGRISKLLGIDKSEIEKEIESRRIDPLKPRVIKRDVEPSTVAFIKEHPDDFPGVEIIDEPVRDYPSGSLAAHILGYIAEISDQEIKTPDFKDYDLGDLVGKSGVEKQYENLLKGTKGAERLEVNAANKPLRQIDRKEPDPGNNLVLTIDKNIQASAESALVTALQQARGKKFKADAGAIVVMDSTNGEVLAMASYPSYDPRIFTGGISEDQWHTLNDKNSLYPLNNRALMSSYPPGSTFKVVTAIAGLRAGTINPSTIFNCAGLWTGWGKKWAKPCWLRSGHGRRDLISALTVSCDVYFYEVGYSLFKRNLDELQLWARKLGLGSKTGIDLPEEAIGRVPDKAWKKAFNKTWPENQAWFPGDTVNMSIGQGDVLVSPLQLATIYQIIANDGKVITPHVVKEILTTDGQAVNELSRPKPRQLDIPAKDLAAIKRGLERVTTDADGTAAGAFRAFPMSVAGKTGTSEVAGKDDFAFFAGYAPVENPKYVFAIVIEQGGHGGAAAAPAARRILSDIYGLNSVIEAAADLSR